MLATTGVICLYFMPESPRFLLSVKKFDEARKVFNIYARVNGKGINVADNFEFKEEAKIRMS